MIALVLAGGLAAFLIYRSASDDVSNWINRSKATSWWDARFGDSDGPVFEDIIGSDDDDIDVDRDGEGTIGISGSFFDNAISTERAAQMGETFSWSSGITSTTDGGEVLFARPQSKVFNPGGFRALQAFRAAGGMGSVATEAALWRAKGYTSRRNYRMYLWFRFVGAVLSPDASLVRTGAAVSNANKVADKPWEGF
uniref:Uncharacterized protein n=1 Tax=viral metagenome TaxID=1070528 RepID=A0A2V0RA82_9ZZZZ